MKQKSLVRSFVSTKDMNIFSLEKFRQLKDNEYISEKTCNSFYTLLLNLIGKKRLQKFLSVTRLTTSINANIFSFFFHLFFK